MTEVLHGWRGWVGMVMAAGLGLALAPPPAAAQAVPLPEMTVVPQPAAEPAPAPMVMYGTSSSADPVGAGDLLDVRVFGQPQLSGGLRVGPDGTIAPPFTTRLQVAGETPAVIQKQLEQAYSRMLLHPLVSVRVAENNSRRVAINGAVPRPGMYAFSGNLSLLQALSMAGGVDPVKASPKILLFHAPPAEASLDHGGQPTYTVNEVLQTIDLRKIASDPGLNRLIQPGDVIEVPEAHQVYISGDVMHPGAEMLLPGLTVTQLISESGGLLPQADGSHVRVLRVNGTSRQVFVVNARAAARNQAPDLQLEADDIVEVPGSMLRMTGLELLDFFTGTERWRVNQSVANKVP